MDLKRLIVLEPIFLQEQTGFTVVSQEKYENYLIQFLFLMQLSQFLLKILLMVNLFDLIYLPRQLQIILHGLFNP